MQVSVVDRQINSLRAEEVPQPSILVILGMHRSGTTLAASWLRQCGLHIGERLSYPWSTNPEGLYEDKDFVELHRAILADQRQTHMLTSHLKLSVDSNFSKKATELVQNRQQYSAWGWKDPRTALFLPFWDRRLPDAKYFIVFRHYVEVVDSLHRRKLSVKPELRGFFDADEIYHEKISSPKERKNRNLISMLRILNNAIPGMEPVRSWLQPRVGAYLNLSKTRLYLQNWIIYNQSIVDFFREHPDHCMCLSIDALINYSEAIVGFLNHQWGFQLSPVSIQAIYQPEKLKQVHPAWQVQLCKLIQPQAEIVYSHLESFQSETLKRIMS